MSGNIKNALLVIVMIGIAVASVMLVIKPNWEAKQTLDVEISQLQTRLAELQAKEADRAIYEAGIVKNEQDFEEILAKFPEDIQQENYFKFFSDIESDKDIDVKMNSYGLTEPEEFYALGSGATTVEGTAPATDAASTDTAATTEASAEATTEAPVVDTTADAGEKKAIDDADLTGIVTNVAIDYTGTYKGVKDLVVYVMGYEDRMTIDTMTLTYDEAEEGLTGAISFNIYAITSESRKLQQPVIDGVKLGTDNIFDTADKSDNKANKKLTSKVEDGSKIVSDYDYYVALNAATSNANSIEIGAKGDSASVLSSNVNEVENATIKFFKVGAKYYVSYNIGDATYPENFEQGVEFDPGEDLNVLIKSSKRKNDKDLAGIKLVIDNETDMDVNVKIDGDDKENGRVRIASKIGSVNVFE